MTSRSAGLTLLEGSDCSMEGTPGSDGEPRFEVPNTRSLYLKWFSLAPYMLSWKVGWLYWKAISPWK